MAGGSRAIIDRFAAACRADTRVVAAFVGGSHAAGTADEHPDLDLHAIVEDGSYDDFFAGRRAFLRRPSFLVFLQDFDDFGWDMVVFILGDGTAGELALARETRFEHIHGGPFEVLADEKGSLARTVFSLYRLTASQQRDELHRLLHWFWHDLSKFGAAMARGRLWSAYGYLEALRLKCVNTARLRHDPTGPLEGYKRLEQAVDLRDLSRLRGAFCPVERRAILEGVRGLIGLYLRMAPSLAHEHGVEYPGDLQRVVSARLEGQCGVAVDPSVAGQNDERG